MASDAKYHATCLAALYNASRKKDSDSNNNELDAETKRYHARAFAELVAFIEDTLVESHDEHTSPVFKLVDLIRLYSDRLTQLGVTTPYVHSSRFKDRILVNFPELQAFKEGRDILLIANDDIGIALRKAYENDAEDEAITLARAARIIHKEVINTKAQFSGTFSGNCQMEAIPRSLGTLVAMMLYGANITEQALVTPTQGFLSICQLVMFNSVKQRQKQVTRHDKSREPPLPVYLGVLIHNKTRKRELVEKLFDLGLSVSYDRVLEISTDAGTEICKHYDQLNAVCPPQLKKGGFTTAAVDNINHQTSSTTANNSFNGTGISIFQHPDNNDATT